MLAVGWWGAAPLRMRGQAKGLARIGAGSPEGQGGGGAPQMDRRCICALDGCTHSSSDTPGRTSTVKAGRGGRRQGQCPRRPEQGPPLLHCPATQYWVRRGKPQGLHLQNRSNGALFGGRALAPRFRAGKYPSLQYSQVR